MRYIIEPKTKKAEQELLENERLKIITRYDPVEKLSVDVEKLGAALKEFKASGVNWRVFNYYLRGRGLSQSMIDAVMGEVKDFFKNMGIL